MALITNLYSALAQGTLWGIMALGVYITFRILDIADLSCDGTFALGGCISAILITRGVNPFVTLLFALVGGMLAGLVTGWLHTKLMIPAILAGILTMIALWSVNIRVMGRRRREHGDSCAEVASGIHTDHESDHNSDRCLYRRYFLRSLCCGSLLVFWNRDRMCT